MLFWVRTLCFPLTRHFAFLQGSDFSSQVYCWVELPGVLPVRSPSHPFASRNGRRRHESAPPKAATLPGGQGGPWVGSCCEPCRSQQVTPNVDPIINRWFWAPPKVCVFFWGGLQLFFLQDPPVYVFFFARSFGAPAGLVALVAQDVRAISLFGTAKRGDRLSGSHQSIHQLLIWGDPVTTVFFPGNKRHTHLGVPSPFFPGILLFRKPSNTRGNRRFLKRTMVEKNGKGINPQNPYPSMD